MTQNTVKPITAPAGSDGLYRLPAPNEALREQELRR